MPEFSMCARPGQSCEVADLCRRHEDSGTVASNWQSWNAFGPPGPDCRGFYPTTDGPDAQRAPGQPTPGVTAADPRGGERTRPAGSLRSGRPDQHRSVRP